MLKKTSIFILTGLLVLCISLLLNGSSAFVRAEETTDLEKITNSEYAKLAEALDISSVNTTVEMGSGYKLFNVDSDDFRNSLKSQAFTKQSTESATGRSSSEVASSYDRKFGLNAAINSGVSTPVGRVGFDVSENFDVSVNQSLATINDEYYEYWEVTKIMKLVQIDWKSKNVDSFLSNEFKTDLSKVTDILSAKALLEKYGTHVFDNYYLGGTLSITRYICSETSVEEDYKENNSTFNLKADITDAINANANKENYYITSKEVNNENTKTSTKVAAKGGNNLNGITPSELFTYKQEIASQYESGYVYSTWLKSIGNCEYLRIVKAEKPVAIWEIVKNSSYYDENTYSLLIKAFDVLCFANYSLNCLKLGISPGYIDSVSYTSGDYNASFELSSDKISLPAGSTATFNYGELLSDSSIDSDIKLSLTDGSSYATLNGEAIIIDDEANGHAVKLELSVLGQKMFELNIEIGLGAFPIGYGTKDQPYLIHDLSEWKQFINNASYYSLSFELASDIDLRGGTYVVGGSTKKTGFFGNLNGNYYSIKNGTVISNAGWNYIGLFGKNYGTISNLYLDNIKVLNTGINSAKAVDASQKPNIDAGILVGKNIGTISDVGVINSSIRIASQLDDNSSLNVGGIVGYSQGTIAESFSNNVNVFGLSYDGSGAVNCGGLIGKIENSSLENCYVSNSSVNASNYYNKIGFNGDLYFNTTDDKLYRKEDGDWFEIGVSGTDRPKANEVKYKYYYDTQAKKLYCKDNKKWVDESIDGVVLSGNKLPKNDVEEKAYYCLGGLVGLLEGSSTVDFAVVYLTRFNQSNKNFGFIAGKAFNEAYFQNCYYEDQSTKAVNNTERDGCSNLRTLTLTNIGNAKWNEYWINGADSHPILKWEVR